MTLLQTILEAFYRSLIRIGQEMSFKILHVCGVIFDPKPHTHFLNNLCSQERFFCVKKLIMILDIMILSIFEHV